MPLVRSRSPFILGFLIAASALGAAFYLEEIANLAPCSLCIVQRVFIGAVGALCFLGALCVPGRRVARRYALASILCCSLGAASAVRQLWLQNYANPADAMCFSGVWHLLTSLPMADAAKALVLGTPDCANVTWTLLGMSLPEWSLLTYCGLAMLAIMAFVRR
ncbi:MULTISPECIES: disulfide bond formation protein B [unclassified Pseudomonas]|uniref:disulfide bond formation protein B n=1 Tax=unclassified Pseudomonas TaxID=196821 RepID=UPI000BD67226|nr:MULTISPECIES: disulfide bond formation protein B [unclassified Pseudomonas]PVZ10412.1 disulfide bond formation protein DsbB [Pseudomonas sp. URIL14HWK12:I12]PVZ21838.1 disulfide bond formation protein DsbB [Pseudomonas sp. URIL14HWK12:I10]PVZ31079.1 disulfide bond formation protein DsbB [Pseudomonas sp. URIL14HWK12:I11]SNZ17710.1 disulfide bond formation protein DsbB [Pseudomonas sp. URIL14HWK12:I9]